MKKLYLYNYIRRTLALGKGIRFAIWMQGCKKRCKNCFTPEAQPLDHGGFFISVQELVRKIVLEESVEGVTITGGEPFLQANALNDLITKLKRAKPTLDYIVYSGYRYDELIKKKECNELIKNIDMLIDGDYDESQNFDTPLIGSNNQEIHILTNRGRSLAESMQALKSRQIEIQSDKNGNFSIVGIPPQKKINILKELELNLLK